MKGFTLIELLAVIAILAIVMLISLPIISGVIDKSRTDSFLTSNKMILKALDSYLINNENLLPINIGETIEIPLQNLVSNNHISSIGSPFNSNNCTGYILVTKTETDYIKNPHINCLENISSSVADGMVFNYKFDDFQEPTENLINYNFSDLEIGQSRDYVSSFTYRITRLDTNKYELLAVTNIPGSNQLQFTPSITWYNNQYATISANIHEMYYAPGSTTTWSLSRVGYGGIHMPNLGYNTYTYLGAWAGIDQLTGLGFRTDWVGASFFVGAGSKIVFSDYQTERKSYATPFINTIRTGIVKDYSINNNIATLSLNNTPKWVVDSSRKNGVYSFNGINNYIEVDNSQNLNIQNQGTISLFAKTSRAYPSNDATTAFKGIISKSLNGGLGGFSFYIDWMGTNATRTLRAGIGDATGESQVISSNFNFNNDWQNIVFTWSGTRLKLYNNGKLIADVPQTRNPQNMLKTIEIGRAFGSNSYNFEGLIDEVKLYNRALSDKEIKLQYELLK